jgi:hypothetical protein
MGVRDRMAVPANSDHIDPIDHARRVRGLRLGEWKVVHWKSGSLSVGIVDLLWRCVSAMDTEVKGGF